MVSDQKSAESLGKPSRALGLSPASEAALSVADPVRRGVYPS
jgi:hypothetical protein